MVVFEIIAVSVAFLTACAAFVTAPRWFSRSLHRHRLWRLRDGFVDHLMDHDLPQDHPAVRQLRWLMKCALDGGRPGNRALDISVFRWAKRGISPLARQELSTEARLCPLDGLTPEQQSLLTQYRANFETLVVGMLLLGSFWGTFIVIRFLPQVIAEERRNRTVASPSWQEARQTVRTATDVATRKTKTGQIIRQELESDPWKRLAPAL